MNERNVKKSRYISKLLRHKPEDLKLNKEGYCRVDALLSKLDITKEDLDWIVDNNNKKRFSYNEDETKIRANQGHSKTMGIKVTMEKVTDIEFLYHGTSSANVDKIKESGLISMSRDHVHMTKDIDTAINVGKRHSTNIVIFQIDSERMIRDGISILISKNGVFLTDKVDPKYLSII
jgi:putative RNA 2'-phosphotransferase